MSQFPRARPSRDGRRGGGRRKRPPKARVHPFTPSGTVDPWLGPLCAPPCDQPQSAPVHRVPEVSEEARHIDARRVGETSEVDEEDGPQNGGPPQEEG